MYKTKSLGHYITESFWSIAWIYRTQKIITLFIYIKVVLIFLRSFIAGELCITYDQRISIFIVVYPTKIVFLLLRFWRKLFVCFFLNGRVVIFMNNTVNNFLQYIYIYIYIYIYNSYSKVDMKTIATTLFPWMAALYPWYVSYMAEC